MDVANKSPYEIARDKRIRENASTIEALGLSPTKKKRPMPVAFEQRQQPESDDEWVPPKSDAEESDAEESDTHKRVPNSIFRANGKRTHAPVSAKRKRAKKKKKVVTVRKPHTEGVGFEDPDASELLGKVVTIELKRGSIHEEAVVVHNTGKLQYEGRDDYSFNEWATLILQNYGFKTTRRSTVIRYEGQLLHSLGIKPKDILDAAAKKM